MPVPTRPVICVVALALGTAPALGGPNVAKPATCPSQADPKRDGQHDFDFEHGNWRTHLWRLQNPLSGSTTWVEYNGVSNVRALLGGRANLIELAVEGSAARIEGVSLRLYRPQTRQWSLHFASVRSGELTTPVVGAFSNGCGAFFAQDTLDGRAILVRFIIQQLSEDTARFEQAFSADDGKTWEVNWVATDTRTR